MSIQKEALIAFELLGSVLFSFMDLSSMGNLFKTKCGLKWDQLYPYNRRLQLYLSKKNLHHRLFMFNDNNTSLSIWNITLSIPKKKHIKHDIKKIHKRYQNTKMLKKSILFILWQSLFDHSNDTQIDNALNDIRYEFRSSKFQIVDIIDFDLLWSNIHFSRKCDTISTYINNRYNENEFIEFVGGSSTFDGIAKPYDNKKKKKTKNNKKFFKKYKFGIYPDDNNNNDNNDKCNDIRDIIFGGTFINIKTFYAAYIGYQGHHYNACIAVINTDNDKNKWNLSQNDKAIVKDTVLVWKSKIN